MKKANGKRVCDPLTREQMERLARIINENKAVLRDKCLAINCGHVDFEDAFQDTVECILRSHHAAGLPNSENVIHFFCFKFRMFAYRARMARRARKEITYADYISSSTKEE